MSKARSAIPIFTFIDEYCQRYQDLFPDVRSFEHFKLVHVGMLSEIKRKTVTPPPGRFSEHRWWILARDGRIS